jgi:hypothetical protein
MSLTYGDLLELLALSYRYIGNEPCSEKELDEVKAIRDDIRKVLSDNIIIYKQTIV